MGMHCNYRSCSGSSYRAERYHHVHSWLSHLQLQVSVGFCIVVAKVRIVDREAGSFAVAFTTVVGHTYMSSQSFAQTYCSVTKSTCTH